MGVFVDTVAHNIKPDVAPDPMSFGRGLTVMFLAIRHDPSVIERMTMVMGGPSLEMKEAAEDAYRGIDLCLEAAEDPARVALQEFIERVEL